MKRLKIMKSYVVLWLFIYFMLYSNIEEMKVFFFASLAFNLAVLTVLSIGIIVTMKSAFSLVMLAGTFGALNGFKYSKRNIRYLRRVDRILPASVGGKLKDRLDEGIVKFTTQEAEDLVEWLSEKFAAQSRYTNYFIGTVLMIGLLGTFAGLLVSIDDMGRIILSLSGDIDLAKVISDFSGPLGGMAVGFGSSLFGVIAAIVMGLMGYILNKNQDVFIEGVEDWLKDNILDENSVQSEDSVFVDTMKALTHQLNTMGENSEALLNVMKSRSQSDEQLTSLLADMMERSSHEKEQTVNVLNSVYTTLQNIDTHSDEHSAKVVQELQAVQAGLQNLEKDTADDNAIIIRELSETLGSAIEKTHTEMSEHLSDLHNSANSVAQNQTDLLISMQELQQNSNTSLEHIHTSSEHNRELLQSLEEHQKISQSALTRQTSAMSSLSELMQNSQQNDASKQRLLKQLSGEVNSVKKEISRSNKQELENISEAINSLRQVQLTQASSQRELLNVQQTLQTTTQKNTRTFEELISSQGEKQTTYLQMINETMIESQQTLEDISQANVDTSEKQVTYLQTINDTMIESQQTLEDIAQANVDTSEKQVTYLQTINDTMIESQQTLEDISNMTPSESSMDGVSSKKASKGFFKKLFK